MRQLSKALRDITSVDRLKPESLHDRHDRHLGKLRHDGVNEIVELRRPHDRPRHAIVVNHLLFILK
ncbi:hypothetical protein [Catelliglobosispora koreensis]|uniref:hypothetical protein n=1 Tax=Catelliglobosispora koreensis TaxID=129052 RepID=UPI0003652256|nr:hypothetical protein [Catelliglobosispora koreensis]